MQMKLWRATMTPLASIIGSGFLISAPILSKVGAELAPFLMIILCLIAYGLGEIIRGNIKEIEPRIGDDTLNAGTKIFEKASDWSLAFAYILSITYYLYIFSSFMLKGTNLEIPGLEQVLATGVFWAIALIGHQNGLDSIEKVEAIAVNLKLAIIATFILGLGYFNYEHGPANPIPEHIQLGIESWQILLGLLIMVQGFETSRYLGEKYKGEMRIKSMRNSQLISMVIYFVFIFLIMKVINLHPIQGEIKETSIIDLSKYVLGAGPVMLLFAALASQLSAAVADMAGSGGLIVELTAKRISSKNSYLIIALIGTALIWCFNIFEVISYASKAFALYYLCQSAVALVHNFERNWSRFALSILGIALCLLVIFYGKSFE